MLPAVTEWGKKFRIPRRKLLMPLSFATILRPLHADRHEHERDRRGPRAALGRRRRTDTGMSFFTLTWSACRARRRHHVHGYREPLAATVRQAALASH